LSGLIEDPDITDIIIKDHRTINYQKGRINFSTPFKFVSQECYENFVERLLSQAKTTYSTKKPIADGIIDGRVRLHAVHKSICETGPYLTLRINRFERISLSELADKKLATKEILLYLENCVKYGLTTLIAGEVGTGKTTLARAVASSIPTTESILVIEDTPEIKLEHPFVRYLVTRESNCEGEGKIRPAECIRAGMRMSMNRIIFGEIRDAEAAESFIDVCASGHPGVSTIHARSATETVMRLQLFLGRAQPSVSPEVLLQQIATAVQVLVHIGICPKSNQRKIMEIRELNGVADSTIRSRILWQYEGNDNWKTINRISIWHDKVC
jgi:pilus assembly protein CpaF